MVGWRDYSDEWSGTVAFVVILVLICWAAVCATGCGPITIQIGGTYHGQEQEGAAPIEFVIPSPDDDDDE